MTHCGVMAIRGFLNLLLHKNSRKLPCFWGIWHRPHWAPYIPFPKTECCIKYIFWIQLSWLFLPIFAPQPKNCSRAFVWIFPNMRSVVRWSSIFMLQFLHWCHTCRLIDERKIMCDCEEYSWDWSQSKVFVVVFFIDFNPGLVMTVLT